MEPGHVGCAGPAHAVDKRCINHGTVGLTTSGGPSLLANRLWPCGLWTCGARFPQAGDRADKLCLTPSPSDSHWSFICSIRDNSGMAPLSPLSTDQLLSSTLYN